MKSYIVKFTLNKNGKFHRILNLPAPSTVIAEEELKNWAKAIEQSEVEILFVEERTLYEPIADPFKLIEEITKKSAFNGIWMATTIKNVGNMKEIARQATAIKAYRKQSRLNKESQGGSEEDKYTQLQ